MRTARVVTERGHRIHRTGLTAAVVVCCLLSTCSSSPSEPQVDYTYTQPEVTGDGWQTASLADANIDLAPITEAIEGIQRGDYPRVHGIVIARHGNLVLEEYFRGQLYLNPVERFGPEVQFDRDRIHQLASVTKSITSTLTGLAIEQGFIEDVDEAVYTFFPEYEELFDEQERTITVEHLLTMTSGWEWSENTEWGVASNDMYGFNMASDPLEYLVNQGMDDEPGTHWVYNGGAVTLLGKLIEKASGMNLEAFSEQYLFTPLGITEFTWPYMRSDLIAAHGDARLRPRDMAKLGQMFLDGGEWGGERQLAEEWVDRATQDALDGPYGYLWWGDSYRGGQSAYRSYSAQGWGGQRIHVFPELDMVVVFTGGNYETAEPVDIIMEQHILPAVGL
ncbi:MAG: serine hydrolase [Gemmatimonadetes bacterium]|nr:serine hydrolase [Gemmatimonadota bacterium]